MTAKEKFYARAKELGIESFRNGGFGHYGVETENGVIVLVHESEEDAFDELRYPTIREISQDNNARVKMFEVFDSIEDFDVATIGRLYTWMLNGNNYDEYPYPKEAGYSSVYFGCNPTEAISFKDDKQQVRINIQIKIEMI